MTTVAPSDPHTKLLLTKVQITTLAPADPHTHTNYQ